MNVEEKEIFYKGFLIDLFLYDNILSYRVLKAMSTNIIELKTNYRCGNYLTEEEMVSHAKEYIDDLKNESEEKDYSNLMKPLI